MLKRDAASRKYDHVHEQHEVVERQRPKPSTKPELHHPSAIHACSSSEDLASDQVAGEHEEKIDARPSVQAWNAEDHRHARRHDRAVKTQHAYDRRGAEPVQSSDADVFLQRETVPYSGHELFT